MFHIFISYSRKDLAAARRIVDALKERDLDTWFDWDSIPKGEDWEKEIYRGIEEADAFLFLISPDSVQSEMCNKEIAYAIANEKRILPVVLRDADPGGFLTEAAREAISIRNWVYYREGRDDFEKAIHDIQTTIRTDYDWVRFHTSLLVKAREWERANLDASRLLRGRGLKDAEKKTADPSVNKEPHLSDLQQSYLKKSRLAAQRRRALPYQLALILALVIFLGGKFYFLLIPIASACPEVSGASIRLEAQGLPADLLQRLQTASETIQAETNMQDCDAGRQAEIRVTATYEQETDRILLAARLPETPAYRLDFLQEIRSFGPEPVSEKEAVDLLQAFAAYAVGEYQAAIGYIETQDNLTALTLLAQAKLFTDDLPGSQKSYELALQRSQPDPDYTGRLLMGAALSWWRPESYYRLSFDGKKDDCLQAGKYYEQAQDWTEVNKLAHNVRIAYAWFCVDEQDAKYAGWKQETPRSEPDPQAQDAETINAVEQFILAQAAREYNDQSGRDLYFNHLSAARPLMLARAALSELYGAEDNCLEARAWREAFREGLFSTLEKEKLQRLLQSQPLVCR